MLIAHASSTCDVCLENYAEDVSYHSIPCGHVFCLPCLMNMEPTRCPLCRHDYSHYSIRKLHLSLPSPRDFEARRLEEKLVNSSPDMSLVESLALFQEVQEWLDSEPQGDFMVLRAFAAVLCNFHETKDKLRVLEERTSSSQVEAEETVAELRRRLEELSGGTSTTSVIDDYKANLRMAEQEISQLRAECALLQSQTAKYQEQEEKERLSYENLHSQYEAANVELNALRTECTTLHAHVDRQTRQMEKQRRDLKMRLAETQKNFADYIAMVEQSALAQHKIQEENVTAAVSRRRSNPLPPPPPPLDINAIKYGNSNAYRIDTGVRKDKGIDLSSHGEQPDPMVSDHVPTLAVSIAGPSGLGKTGASGGEGHSEVTTLLFKPPVRMPTWPVTSQVDGDANAQAAGPSTHKASARAVDAVAGSSQMGSIPPNTESGARLPKFSWEVVQSSTYPHDGPPSPGPSQARPRADLHKNRDVIPELENSLVYYPPGPVKGPSWQTGGSALARRVTSQGMLRASRRTSSPGVAGALPAQFSAVTLGPKEKPRRAEVGLGTTCDYSGGYPREPFPVRDGSLETTHSKAARRVEYDMHADYADYYNHRPRFAQSTQFAPGFSRDMYSVAYPSQRPRRESSPKSYARPSGPSSSTSLLPTNDVVASIRRPGAQTDGEI